MKECQCEAPSSKSPNHVTYQPSLFLEPSKWGIITMRAATQIGSHEAAGCINATLKAAKENLEGCRWVGKAKRPSLVPALDEWQNL